MLTVLLFVLPGECQFPSSQVCVEPCYPPGCRNRSWSARSGCGRVGCLRPVGGSEQFDEVAVWVGERDLALADADRHGATPTHGSMLPRAPPNEDVAADLACAWYITHL